MSLDFGSATTNGSPSPMCSGSSESSQQDHQTTISSESTEPQPSQSSEPNPSRSSVRSSLLCVAATGLGKTCLMGGIAGRWSNGRVMMISHRYELNTQAIKEFERVCGEPVDLEQAQFFADRMSSKPTHIVVASVQTLNSRRKGRYRMERFRPTDFGLLMIDECHRAAADSYRRVINYFRQGNPDVKVLGVTATPDRLDGVGMGCVFDEVACDYNLLWSIENGWLVAPKQVFIKVNGLDLSQVRTVGGDLDEKQLAKLVEQEQSLHEMAKPIVDICGETDQAIVFTASVEQAKRLADKIIDYRREKYGASEGLAVSVDGAWTPQDPRRRDVVARYKAGAFQYLVNCAVFTEGFDAPNTKVIAIGRPTKSRALYQQCLGRGTRPLPGVVDGPQTIEGRLAAIAASAKPYCTVIDFVGQSGRHKLVCSTDILAGSQPEEVIDRAKHIQRNSNFRGSTLDAIREAQDKLEKEREARRAKVTVGVNYQVIDASAGYDVNSIPKVFCPGYLLKVKPTEKQRNFMLKLGYTTTQIDGMNTRQARAAIDYAINHPKTSTGRWVKQQRQKAAADKAANEMREPSW